MRIEEETRNYSAQNNESSQFKLQECLFVIREKVARTQLIGCTPTTRLGQVGDTCSSSERRVRNNLPYIRDRRNFTVIATVKKTLPPPSIKLPLIIKKPYPDEELREFTSEYYIPSALHPVVPAADASIADFPVGKVGVYTRCGKNNQLRSELSPIGNPSHGPFVPCLLSLLLVKRMGIVREARWAVAVLYRKIRCAKALEGDVLLEMDLFSVVHLSKPKLVTEGVRPLRDGEEPLLESTAGRTMELVLGQPEFDSTYVLAPTPLRSVPGAAVGPPRPDATSVGSSEGADAAEVDSGLKRKRATGDVGAGPSKRVRHFSLVKESKHGSKEEVPTFIGDDGQEMDLFSVVHLSKPKLVTEGVRPLRDGEEPLLESTAGRTMELVLEQPEVESTDVLAPTPLRSVPGATVEPPRLDATSVGSSEDADVAGAESEAGEVDSGLKRKRATSDDGAGTSKRVRHVSLGGSTSTEEETPDAPPTLAAKEVTETPPPNVEATSDSSAPVTHAVQSPPQTSPLTADDISRRDRETGPKAFEGMPVDQLMEEFDMVTAQQAALVAQLRARFSSERSQSVQKDEEILLLKTQLADAQAEAESSRSYAQKLAEEKMALLVKVEQERANSADYKASCHWAVKYLEGGKNNHFAGLDEFRQRVEGLLEKQEEKLRKLSIEYDEELYPHMLSAIAERRWLISHGLRLAAMSTLESQEVKQSFGDVVKCALARGKAEAVEELHEKKLLTVPAAQVPGYNHNAYEELVAAMEAMKLLELPHIGTCHATEGLRPTDYFLEAGRGAIAEAHAIRLAKKKGVKGKAILCGVGAAHIPRSDGVPVSVATVSPKDSELLGKLEEAGDAAYQVGSSERSRCHSI
ncbi:hypothetical protein Tco_0428622 [Tanacetum coccineum]